MSVYQFSIPMINGDEKPLSDYAGHVVLIVNTATKCGFAPQLKELESLYEKYKDQGFVVIGFPCSQFKNQEPGPDKEVIERCQLNFGVHFPLTKKIDVKGEKAHPLFNYLTKQKKGLLTERIKWNFTKFLIDRQGNVVSRYAPLTAPMKLEVDIIKLLNE